MPLAMTSTATAPILMGLPYPAARSIATGFRRASASRIGLFQDNPYIRALNEILQYELTAIHTYRKAIRRFGRAQHLSRIIDDHVSASKTLVNMIISHRGIPADHGSHAAAITARTILTFDGVIPGRIRTIAQSYAIRQFESTLVDRYDFALSMAPQSDFITLETLKTRIDSNAQQLATM